MGILFGLLVKFTPNAGAYIVQGLHRPFDNVKGVDASMAVRQHCLNPIVDPASAIPCNHFNAFSLLLRQFIQELHEDGFAVSLMGPDD